MRKRSREVTDEREIRRILDTCKVIRLGLNDDGQVYIVPLNYGYTFEDGKLTFFLHGATEGRKLDILRKNNRVGFELDCDSELKPATGPCGYDYYYSSIIGTGTVTILESPVEKAAGLNILMEHQAGKPVPVPEKATTLVSVFRLDAAEFAVKQNLPSPVK